MEVYDFEEISKLSYLSSKQGKKLITFLKKLNSSTFIVEENYIDTYYMIDYSKFHSRTFNAPPRVTTRIHFFRNKPFEKDSDLTAFLKKGNGKNIEALNGNYIGFVVVKPIKNELGYEIIGRTIIDPYEDSEKQNIKYLVVKKHSSLYGIPLDIQGLPYQTQDTMVCACATVAIWTSLHPLNKLFNFPIYSPCEITEKAVKTPSTFRSFPSSGLSLQQMIYFFKTEGLDIEPLRIRNFKQELLVSATFIEDAIKAFLHCNLPIIATLTLKQDDKEDNYHAVVISGYKKDSKGQIKEIYVHDDGIGPYTETKPIDNLGSWSNDWLTDGKKNEILLDRLIIPIYPKIRLTFAKIHRIFEEYKEKAKNVEDLSLDLFLTQVEEYKEFLLKFPIKNKDKTLKKPLPKFLWVVRGRYKKYPIFDDIYDATSVFPEKVHDIEYVY